MYVVQVDFTPRGADDNMLIGRWAQPHAIHVTIMFIEHAFTVIGVVRCTPNTHCFIETAADNCIAVECHTMHMICVSLECVHALARLQIPHSHCVIRTARD